ncbi:hypothetical protein Y956_15900, partial [Nipponia nippon]
SAAGSACLAPQGKTQVSRMPKRAAPLSSRAFSSWYAAVTYHLHKWGFHEAISREIKII